ncbi:hypothetical protein P8C59_008165 [Phyllachora maydis]|uniref:Uncharacterized protein n=1 Tax=Phyllachora maydis TaxID=1825666 RepID=A0AAD9I9X4_9PEZI|nr:hypothetical protein P8C59_008165 [Phyllachora maydis]
MLPEECIRKPNKAHLLSARAKDVPKRKSGPRARNNLAKSLGPDKNSQLPRPGTPLDPFLEDFYNASGQHTAQEHTSNPPNGACKLSLVAPKKNILSRCREEMRICHGKQGSDVSASIT